jgi:hypothetical protein
MGRADALPAVGRRRDLAVRADWRGVGVIFQAAGDMERVELGEDARALLVKGFDLRGVELVGTDPDGIDA